MVSGCEAEGTWQAGALCPERRASGIQSLLSHVGSCPPRRGERVPLWTWNLWGEIPSGVRRPHGSGELGLQGAVWICLPLC